MRALVHDPYSPVGLTPGNAPEPVAGNDEVVIDVRGLGAGGTRLEIMTKGGDSAPTSRCSSTSCGRGDLDPHVGLLVAWQDHESAVEALPGRRVNGKAVLEVTS